MTLFYDDRPCGSGKTYSELLHMITNRGLYLLAVDRVEAMRERVSTIVELSRKSGKRPRVISVESGDLDDCEQRGAVCTIRSRSVTTQVAALPEMYKTGHVIAVVTHEALKRSDLAGYGGWSLVIDETPSVFDQQRLRTSLTREFFEEHYELVPIGARSILRSRSRATAADFRHDSLTEVLTVMHARVLSDRITVLTDLTSWDQLSADRDWVWWSIWSPEQLVGFDKVTVLANAFTRSHTYSLFTRLWPEIGWQPAKRFSTLVYTPRVMTIRYYAEAHSASRSLFSSEVGKERLRLIGADIAQRADPKRHIWTCNSADLPVCREPLRASVRLSPRQAGSNAYAAMTSASILYTAKPDPEERCLLRDLGIDPQVVTETREFETIYQFTSRIAVRDPKSAEPLTVHVYDRAQAEYLSAMFCATGYVTCNLKLIDLGFAHAQPPSGPGRKAVVKSPEEVARAAEKKRAAARDRKRRSRAKSASVHRDAADGETNRGPEKGKSRSAIKLRRGDYLLPLFGTPLLTGRAEGVVRALGISSTQYKFGVVNGTGTLLFRRLSDEVRFRERYQR